MPGRRTAAVSPGAIVDGTPILAADGETPVPIAVDDLSTEFSGDGAGISGDQWDVTSVSNGGSEYFSDTDVTPAPPCVVSSATSDAWSGSSRLMGATTAVGTCPPSEAGQMGRTRLRHGWTRPVDVDDRASSSVAQTDGQSLPPGVEKST